MAAERDLDLLDDYLANRLDATGRSAFEQKLANDPSLKAEFELQQQFVQGIHKARAAELKAFMNSIPVPPPSTGVVAAGKIAATVIIAGAIGTGLYFAFNSEEKVTTTPDVESPVNSTPTDSQEREAEVISPETEEAPEVPAEKSASESAPVEGPKAMPKAKQTPANPKVEVFDPTQEQNEPVADIDNLGIPRPESTPALSVSVRSDKKFDFHYQFDDGQLLLYGPFEKNLYEILEFFNGEKKTAFLMYKEQFYYLKEDDQQIRPLVPIKDPAVVKKLKEYRAQ